MRTLSGGLATHLAGSAHTRCAMVRLDLKDGSILAFTDHDQDLVFSLGDGPVTYSAGTGILPSNLALSTGFGADDIEIQGPITETGLTTRAAILGGRFDDAVSKVFQVNWSDLTQGPIRLLLGRVVLPQVEGGRFNLTLQSDKSRFAQEIGRTITGFCDADFGDARCGLTVIPLAAVVTAVTDERAFTVSFTGSYADDYFNMGTVQFTAGALNGTRPVEVFGWTAAGAITLWTGLVEPPAIGDTLNLKQGCGKTRAACMAFNNIVNGRFFPDVPGSDQVLKYPNPGA